MAKMKHTRRQHVREVYRLLALRFGGATAEVEQKEQRYSRGLKEFLQKLKVDRWPTDKLIGPPLLTRIERMVEERREACTRRTQLYDTVRHYMRNYLPRLVDVLDQLPNTKLRLGPNDHLCATMTTGTYTFQWRTPRLVENWDKKYGPELVLGPYEILIDVEQPVTYIRPSGDWIQATRCNGDNVFNKGRYYHWHVAQRFGHWNDPKGGYPWYGMCLGDYYNFGTHMALKEYVKTLLNLESLLAGFRPEPPYSSVEDWFTPTAFCVRCNKNGVRYTKSKCCGQFHCPACTAKHVGTAKCYQCMETNQTCQVCAQCCVCTTCKKPICRSTGCMKTCGYCGNRVCPTCKKENARRCARCSYEVKDKAVKWTKPPEEEADVPVKKTRTRKKAAVTEEVAEEITT